MVRCYGVEMVVLAVIYVNIIISIIYLNEYKKNIPGAQDVLHLKPLVVIISLLVVSPLVVCSPRCVHGGGGV